MAGVSEAAAKVARAAKAGDPAAERAARAELAVETLRQRLTSIGAAGVQLSAEQAAELRGLVDGLADDGAPLSGRVHMTF